MDQIVGRRPVKARIGAQELHELREAAFEPARGDDAVHGGANALHLRQSNRMNLLGREVGRGRCPRPDLVPGHSVGKIAYPGRGARARDVLAPQEAAQLPKRRCDGVAIGGERRHAQPLLVRRRHAGGKVRKRAQQGARDGVIHDEVLGLRRHVAQRDPRRGDSRREAALQPEHVVPGAKVHPRDLAVDGIGVLRHRQERLTTACRQVGRRRSGGVLLAAQRPEWDLVRNADVVQIHLIGTGHQRHA